MGGFLHYCRTGEILSEAQEKMGWAKQKKTVMPVKPKEDIAQVLEEIRGMNEAWHMVPEKDKKKARSEYKKLVKKAMELGITHIGNTYPCGEAIEGLTMNEAKGIPDEAVEYKKYYVGYDDGVKKPEGGEGAHVFEFEDDEILDKFLSDVGGAPHPLGGTRAILSEAEEESISSHPWTPEELDTELAEVPEKIKTVVKKIVALNPKIGSADPMYIANAIALKLGLGNGETHFEGDIADLDPATVDAIAERISSSFGATANFDKESIANALLECSLNEGFESGIGEPQNYEKLQKEMEKKNKAGEIVATEADEDPEISSVEQVRTIANEVLNRDMDDADMPEILKRIDAHKDREGTVGASAVRDIIMDYYNITEETGPGGHTPDGTGPHGRGMGPGGGRGDGSGLNEGNIGLPSPRNYEEFDKYIDDLKAWLGVNELSSNRIQEEKSRWAKEKGMSESSLAKGGIAGPLRESYDSMPYSLTLNENIVKYVESNPNMVSRVKNKLILVWDKTLNESKGSNHVMTINTVTGEVFTKIDPVKFSGAVGPLSGSVGSIADNYLM